jgi:hypothetical protein
MCAQFRPCPATDDPAALWLPDPGSLLLWHDLVPGTTVTIVKRAFDGTEAARYPAVVADEPTTGPWRTLIATWVLPTTTQGSLTFAPGDILHERFSPMHPFNTFGVQRPDGHFKGWYANVTWPTFLERTADGFELTWQDCYLDLVVTPNGTDLLDEDELAEAPISLTHPHLTAAIHEIARTVQDLALAGLPPFIIPTSR